MRSVCFHTVWHLLNVRCHFLLRALAATSWCWEMWSSVKREESEHVLLHHFWRCGVSPVRDRGQKTSFLQIARLAENWVIIPWWRDEFGFRRGGGFISAADRNRLQPRMRSAAPRVQEGSRDFIYGVLLFIEAFVQSGLQGLKLDLEVWSKPENHPKTFCPSSIRLDPGNHIMSLTVWSGFEIQ